MVGAEEDEEGRKTERGVFVFPVRDNKGTHEDARITAGGF